jgi:ankyrin repeat protein
MRESHGRARRAHVKRGHASRPVLATRGVYRGPAVTELMRAIEAGDDARVNEILACGAAAEERDDEGRAPLVLAAGLGHSRIVQALVASGARSDRADRWGETPVHAAARCGHEAVLAILVGSSAVLEMPGRDGMTALLAAASVGHEGCFRLLLAAGADPLAHNRRCHPALVLAARVGSDAIVSELLARGADPNFTTYDDRTAVRAAAEAGHAGIVRRLVAAGASTDAKRSGVVPLSVLAARRGDLDTLDALASAPASLGARDALGRSALDHARRRGHRTCVERLVASGLDAADAHPLDRMPASGRAAQIDLLERLARVLDVTAAELLDVLVFPIASGATRWPESVDLAPAHRALLEIADGLRLEDVTSEDEPLTIFSSAEVELAAVEVEAARHLAPISTTSWVPHLISVDARTGGVWSTDYELPPDEHQRIAESPGHWIRRWLAVPRDAPD